MSAVSLDPCGVPNDIWLQTWSTIPRWTSDGERRFSWSSLALDRGSREALCVCLSAVDRGSRDALCVGLSVVDRGSRDVRLCFPLCADARPSFSNERPSGPNARPSGSNARPSFSNARPLRPDARPLRPDARPGCPLCDIFSLSSVDEKQI